MAEIVGAFARAAGGTPDAIRDLRGCKLRGLVAWIGWHEGLATLRSIAASLRLRSEGHVSNLIKRCEHSFRTDAQLLAHYDHAITALRA